MGQDTFRLASVRSPYLPPVTGPVVQLPFSSRLPRQDSLKLVTRSQLPGIPVSGGQLCQSLPPPSPPFPAPLQAPGSPTSPQKKSLRSSSSSLPAGLPCIVPSRSCNLSGRQQQRREQQQCTLESFKPAHSVSGFNASAVKGVSGSVQSM